MLTIRKEQLRVFEHAAMANFVERMVAHLRRVFPDWAAEMTDDACRAFVRSGVASAASHGITIELHVARYLHVMQALGKDFDQSPEHAWAANILERAELTSLEKLDRLSDGVVYSKEARRIADGF